MRIVPVANCEVAEACKILENTYRSVNIAMVNELKVLFDRIGIDVWEVIEAAKTKPFGFQAFYPGPGLGGHCIPIDPFYLSWLAASTSPHAVYRAGWRSQLRHAPVGRQQDRRRPERRRQTDQGDASPSSVSPIRKTSTTRESPAFRILELLEEHGAVLSYHDPHIPRLPSMRYSGSRNLPVSRSRQSTWGA